MPRVVWAGDSKTGLSFEIGQSQQKFQRKSTLQSLANPAVCGRGGCIPRLNPCMAPASASSELLDKVVGVSLCLEGKDRESTKGSASDAREAKSLVGRWLNKY